MALTPQQIAAELNRLTSQGLTLEQAEQQVPGATALLESTELILNDVPGSPTRGQVEVYTTGSKKAGVDYNVYTPTAEEQAENARFFEDPPPTNITNQPVVSSPPLKTTTTTTTFTEEQVSTSGGGVTTFKVADFVYKDTPASRALQTQADSVGLEKEAYAQSLRDQGKSGREILRDPTYRELSAKQTALNNRAFEAKSGEGGEVTTTYEPGVSETINSTTVTSSVTNSQVPQTAQTRITTEAEATRQQVAALDSGDSAVNTTKIAGAEGNNTLVQTNTVEGAATASPQASFNTAQPRSIDAPVNTAISPELTRPADTNSTSRAYQTQVDDYRAQVNDLKSDLEIQQTQLKSLEAARAKLGEELKSAAPGSPEQAEILAKRNALNSDISDQENKIGQTNSVLAIKEQSLTQSQDDLARVSSGGSAPAPGAPAVTGNADPAANAINQQAAEINNATPNTTTVNPELDSALSAQQSATDDEIDQQRENQLITVDEDGNFTAENPYTAVQGGDDAELTDEQIDLARENQLIEQDEDGNLTAENPYDVQGGDDAQLTDEQIDLERENQLIVQDEDGNLTAENPYTAIGDRELSEEEQQEQDNPIDYSNEVEVDPYSDVEGDYGEREEGTGDDVVEVGPDGSLTARAQTQAEVETLRQAQALQQLRAKNTNEDWRLRIGLAPGANYLYRAPDAGILQPLRETQGVVFPYTPTISTSYRANYDAYELVHTNYKGYFYKNSSVQEISVTGVFTANSAAEADYMLAVIHFFRSASKMFYGQDSNPVAGTPPPVLYLDGLGVYQFNEHPCLLSAFNYSLPSDVDYIRAGGARNYSGGAVNLAGIRNQQGAASNSPLGATLSRLTSLKNTFDNFINPGARANNPVSQNITNYYGIAGQPTYVPTKIDISITLLPLISRQQQAQVFSLKNYATGQGLREQGFF